MSRVAVFVGAMVVSVVLFAIVVFCLKNKVEEFYRRKEIGIYVLLTAALYLIYYVIVVILGTMDNKRLNDTLPLVNTCILFSLIAGVNILYDWQQIPGQEYGVIDKKRVTINGILMIGMAVVFSISDLLVYKGVFLNLSATLLAMFLGFFVSLTRLVEQRKTKICLRDTVKMLKAFLRNNKREIIACSGALLLCLLITLFSDVADSAWNGAVVGFSLSFIISVVIFRRKLKGMGKKRKKREKISVFYSRVIKGIKIVITGISLLGAIYFKNVIDFSNLKRLCFAQSNARDFGADICIGIFSAMILVWLIDGAKEKQEKKVENKKQMILFRKLVPFLNDYYTFYLNLYITTKNEPVLMTSKVLNSVFACKEELIAQIKEADPFYKQGFYADPRKFEQMIHAMQHAKEEELERIMKLNSSLPVYQCWAIDSGKFVDGVEELERKFLDFFPSDLLDMVDRLLDAARSTKYVREMIDHVGEFYGIMGQFHQGPLYFPVDYFVSETKLLEALELLENVIDYVETETKQKIRKRDLEFFNNRNTKPILGDSYKCE